MKKIENFPPGRFPPPARPPAWPGSRPPGSPPGSHDPSRPAGVAWPSLTRSASPVCPFARLPSRPAVSRCPLAARTARPKGRPAGLAGPRGPPARRGPPGTPERPATRRRMFALPPGRFPPQARPPARQVRPALRAARRARRPAWPDGRSAGVAGPRGQPARRGPPGTPDRPATRRRLFALPPGRFPPQARSPARPVRPALRAARPAPSPPCLQPGVPA